MRQVLLVGAVIWFIIQALPGDVDVDGGRATFELLQRLSIGLALLSSAFLPWPRLPGFLGVDVDVQVKGDGPASH